MNTVLLGTAFGLEANELRIFLNSTRRNGYDGDIVIFGDAIVGLPIGIDYLKLFYDTGVKYHFVPKKPDHFFCKRWGLYIPILENHKYDYAMGIDIRDCVVQTNLDDMWMDGLHVTEESASIRDEDYNTQWILEDFGQNVLDSIGHMPIINGGCVWGDYGCMWFYCDYMNDYTGRAMDQGALNGAVRTGKFPAIVHPNREKVWTLALEKSFENRLESGKMIIGEHTPAVIHQYDRFLNLAKYFKGYYGHNF